ncbi:MAG: omptin family outer membrane protease [Fusobacterium necrophorum]|nr:omptin family outer membrane protease [Fusobacterium necrophorum]
MKKYLFTLAIIFSSISYANGGKISAEIQDLNGKAGEFVYDKPGTGRKISRLDWEIKNIPMLKLGYQYEYNNWEFSIEGRKNIKNKIKSGKMKDYDWIPGKLDDDDAKELFEIATYENRAAAEADKKENEKIKDNGNGTYSLFYAPTEKDAGTLFSYTESSNYVKDIWSLNLSAKYYLIKDEKIKFAPFFGLNYHRYEFYSVGAKGYEYIPSRGRKSQEFANVKSITYEQMFLNPYIGLYTSYSPSFSWEIQLGLKGTAWGRARAIDRHLLRREMKTDEKYKNIKYLSSTLAIKYYWSESLTLKYELEFTKHFRNTKSTVNRTNEDGTKETEKGSAGLSNRTMASSLGFEYKL